MSKELEKEYLEALEKLLEGYSKGIAGRSYYDIIYQALIRSQEQEKVLEIIKEKGVNVGYLRICKTLDDYNSDCWNDEEDFNKKLTQEEFDLLKRCFKRIR